MTVSPTSFTSENSYAYCDNNPVIKVDQDGEFAHIVIGSVIGAGFEIASQLVATVVGGITAATGLLMGAIYGYK